MEALTLCTIYTLALIYTLVITVFHTLCRLLVTLACVRYLVFDRGAGLFKGGSEGADRPFDRASVGVGYMGDRYVGLQSSWWGIYAVLAEVYVCYIVFKNH
jgi:hypothetical protein